MDFGNFLRCDEIGGHLFVEGGNICAAEMFINFLNHINEIADNFFPTMQALTTQTIPQTTQTIPQTTQTIPQTTQTIPQTKETIPQTSQTIPQTTQTIPQTTQTISRTTSIVDKCPGLNVLPTSSKLFRYKMSGGKDILLPYILTDDNHSESYIQLRISKIIKVLSYLLKEKGLPDEENIFEFQTLRLQHSDLIGQITFIRYIRPSFQNNDKCTLPNKLQECNRDDK